MRLIRTRLSLIFAGWGTPGRGGKNAKNKVSLLLAMIRLQGSAGILVGNIYKVGMAGSCSASF